MRSEQASIPVSSGDVETGRDRMQIRTIDSALKMEAVYPSEKLVQSRNTARRNDSKDRQAEEQVLGTAEELIDIPRPAEARLNVI